MNYSTEPGIYKITCIKNKKVYIGQTINLRDRIATHKWSLRKGNHYNSYLQRAFNKYGEENFSFDVLEECENEYLDEKEIFWIDLFDSTNRFYGYNAEKGGCANKVVHEETKEKIRVKMKVMRLGEGNPMYGKKLSKEHCEIISQRNRGTNSQLNEEIVREIKIAFKMGIMQSELSDIFDLKISTVNKIVKGHNWSWVLTEFNDCQKEEIEKIKKEKCKKTEDVEEKHKNIIQDYKNGLSRDELSVKYNMHRNSISVILKEETQREFAERNVGILEMHKKGFKNKEIADHFNIHRTTVTEVVKGRIKEKKKERVKYSEDLEREIMNLLEKGFSQRKISDTLSISRNTVKKAVDNKTKRVG